MILHVYAIRDRATDQFSTPMFLVSNGQAIRSFTDEVNRVGNGSAPNPLYDHPDDFDLFHLGTFDSDNGQFDTGRPAQLCIGKDVKIRS